MTISKCILFATIILGPNFAQAAIGGSNCANAAAGALTNSRQKAADTAEALNRTHGNAAPKTETTSKSATGASA